MAENENSPKEEPKNPPSATPKDQPTQPPSGEPMDRESIASFGVYFVLVGLILFYLAFVVWPPDFQSLGTAGNASKDPAAPVIFLYPQMVKSPASAAIAPDEDTRLAINITYDQRLLLMVFLLGALGSYIHVVTSFADYVGNRRLIKSWTWWYLLRPFVGAPTGVVFYFAVRAGFMSANSTGGDVNRFGIAAVAMLVGMFSMKATDKLEEVFDVLFKTVDKRKDTLSNRAPVLKSIKPESVKAGSQEKEIQMEGTNFPEKAVVLVDGKSRTPHESTPTLLKIKLTAEELTTARKIKLAVKGPPPADAVSEEREFTVEP